MFIIKDEKVTIISFRQLKFLSYQLSRRYNFPGCQVDFVLFLYFIKKGKHNKYLYIMILYDKFGHHKLKLFVPVHFLLVF